jgi:hypothetical protein
MKKLFFSLLLALSVIGAKADAVVIVPLTAGVVSNIVSGSYLVDNITLISTTTNLTTAKFYDAATAITNIVRAAYTSYAGYATNYTVVFTNSATVLVTNTYSGWYTAPTSNAAVTNSRPVVYTIQSPGSSITSKDLLIGTIKGLSVVSDQDAQVAVTYRGNP